MMWIDGIVGLLIPFAGTLFGSACVFFMRKTLRESLRGILCGFAAGVMTAAAVWSLLIPALEEPYTKWLPDWVPATVGFMVGIVGLIGIDRLLPMEGSEPKEKKRSDRLLLLAVTVHNLPEGMAVGAMIAGYLCGKGEISRAAVMALSVGIALQNFPEGAIVSLPLHASGMRRRKACLMGALSGVVEPIGGLLLLAAAELLLPILPYLLGFAAGAMIYVVVEELLPELQESLRSPVRILPFAAGFCCMMLLDHILSAG